MGAGHLHARISARDLRWLTTQNRRVKNSMSVLSFTKNQNLGFTVPYSINNVEHQYYPDFVVRLDDGQGKDDPLNVILEVTGERKKEKDAKSATARTPWVPAVNNHVGFGRWAFPEIADPYDDVVELIRSSLNQGSLFV
jgi:type III restriction enzyme